MTTMQLKKKNKYISLYYNCDSSRDNEIQHNINDPIESFGFRDNWLIISFVDGDIKYVNTKFIRRFIISNESEED